MVQTYPPVDSLLPHRPPMLWVEQILDVQGSVGIVRALVKAEHLFLRQDGALAPEAYCELIAQGFGACEAYRRIKQGLSINGGGYLVSVRDMQCLALARAGDELTVCTEKTDECFDTYIVQGQVFRQEEKLAQAVVYVYMWQGKEPPKQ